MTGAALNGNLVLVGAGKMGGALLAGWLAQGIAPNRLHVIDPAPPDEIATLIKQHGISHNPELAGLNDIGLVLIAVKPQMMADVLPQIAILAKMKPIFLSVAAGITLTTYGAHLGADAAIIRSIPNTPAAVGRGITAFCCNSQTSPQQRQVAVELLSSVGEVVEVEREEQIDAVTAVSGSGPAYIFYLTECLTAAAQEVGLPADIAVKLARATVSGAGELMHQSGIDAAVLRKNVTSPNGTTHAALLELMADDALKPLIARAVAAAEKRSRELAG